MNYNQNDSIYGSVMLGFSKKYTLKSSGCYVFSLAHLLGIDPIVCNDTLKKAKSFMADETGDVCLHDHTKIAAAFPDRISSVAKYDTYDNDACLEAIAENGGCIVKVQNGSYTHFVEFIGNKLLFDSLGGKEKPTSAYSSLLGLRVINLKSESESNIYKGIDVTNVESVKACIDVRDDLMNGKYISVDEHKRIINELDSKSTEAAQTYAKEKQILEDKIKVLDNALYELQNTEHTWQDTADRYQRLLQTIVVFIQKQNIPISIDSSEEEIVAALSSATHTDEINNLYSAISSRLILKERTPSAVLEAIQSLEEEYNQKIEKLKKPALLEQLLNIIKQWQKKKS